MCEYRICGYFTGSVVLGISSYLVGEDCMLYFVNLLSCFNSAVQSG